MSAVLLLVGLKQGLMLTICCAAFGRFVAFADASAATAVKTSIKGWSAESGGRALRELPFRTVPAHGYTPYLGSETDAAHQRHAVFEAALLQLTVDVQGVGNLTALLPFMKKLVRLMLPCDMCTGMHGWFRARARVCMWTQRPGL